MCFLTYYEPKKRRASKPILVYKISGVPQKSPDEFISNRLFKYKKGVPPEPIDLYMRKKSFWAFTSWDIFEGYYSFLQREPGALERLLKSRAGGCEKTIGVFEIPVGAEYYFSSRSILADSINWDLWRMDNEPRRRARISEVVSSSLIFKGYYDGSITPNGK